jgi:hypothetical protein
MTPEAKAKWQAAIKAVERRLREEREREARQRQSVEEFVASRLGWGEKETV